MTTKTPAYAKAKTITSRSGAAATGKHIVTLQRAQALLAAQDDTNSRAAANLMATLIAAYRVELRTYYQSEHNPYRTPEREGEVCNIDCYTRGCKHIRSGRTTEQVIADAYVASRDRMIARITQA